MPSEKPSMGFDADFIDNDIQKAEEWNEISHQAVLNNQVILEGHSVAIPIRVSGQAVGAIEFDVDTDTIDQIDLDMLEEVGSRLGLAIENMRLLINTQRASSREARMNEISTRLQERNDVESTLTETARGLQDILNAQNVSIRLKVEQG
jgi:GAF domain-containing protein